MKKLVDKMFNHVVAHNKTMTSKYFYILPFKHQLALCHPDDVARFEAEYKLLTNKN